MKTYLLSLILASALSAGALYLSSGRKFEKHIKYLASLIVLCAMLAPLPSLANKELPSLFHLDGVTEVKDTALYDQAITEAFSKGVREEIVSLIARKCDLEESDFDVNVTVSCKDKKLNIDKVEILLKDLRSIVKREQMRTELEELCVNVEFIEFSREKEK